jgi:hypothetical protein
MIQAGIRWIAYPALAAIVVLHPGWAQAQAVERGQPGSTVQTPAQQGRGDVYVPPGQDAREVRQQLEALLRLLPPSVGRVLRLDPSLMRNETYLAPYRDLAAFLKQHPEIVNNPGFYLENVSLQLWYAPAPSDPRSQAIHMWRNAIEGLAIFTVFFTITVAVLWIIRSILEYRRWNRTARAHAEFQNKMLDRFTSNEDLLVYMQTPVGLRLLDQAPLPVEAPVRPIGSPFGRILWSVQAGMVLVAGGFGLLFVSGRVIEEVAQVIFAVGVLALAIGVGFVVSAAVSLLLSQRLGLLGAGPAREHSAPTGA